MENTVSNLIKTISTSKALLKVADENIIVMNKRINDYKDEIQSLKEGPVQVKNEVESQFAARIYLESFK